MTWLVTTSLRLRVLVIALSAILVVFGARTLETTPLDVFPEFAPPLVEIQTEAPGLSTEEVESLISMPLENALNGIPWLKIIRSKSVLGLSSVVLIFESGTDLIRSGKCGAAAAGDRSQPVAGSLPAAGHSLAAFVDQPRVEDRHDFAHHVADGYDDPGQMDDPPAPDGGARRGERGDLGAARPAVANPGRSRAFAGA